MDRFRGSACTLLCNSCKPACFRSWAYVFRTWNMRLFVKGAKAHLDDERLPVLGSLQQLGHLCRLNQLRAGVTGRRVPRGHEGDCQKADNSQGYSANGADVGGVHEVSCSYYPCLLTALATRHFGGVFAGFSCQIPYKRLPFSSQCPETCTTPRRRARTTADHCKDAGVRREALCWQRDSAPPRHTSLPPPSFPAGSP